MTAESAVAVSPASARCFGRFETRLMVLRLDAQCHGCVRRNLAIADSVATLPRQIVKGVSYGRAAVVRPGWVMPEVGGDGVCAHRIAADGVRQP